MKFNGTIKLLELTKEQFVMVVNNLEKADSVFGSSDKGELTVIFEQYEPESGISNGTFSVGETYLKDEKLNVGKKISIEFNEIEDLSDQKYISYLTKEELLASDTKYTFDIEYPDINIKYKWILDIPTSIKTNFEYLKCYNIKLEVVEDI